MASTILIICSGALFAAFEFYWYLFSHKDVMRRPAAFDKGVVILGGLTLASFLAACLSLMLSGHPVRSFLLLVLAAAIHYSTDMLAYRKEINTIIRELRESGLADKDSDAEVYQIAKAAVNDCLRKRGNVKRFVQETFMRRT